MIQNTEASYGSVSKTLHWLIFLAVLGLLIVGFIMTDLEDSDVKWQVYMLHKSIGFSVLVLMIARVAWVFANPHPGYPTTLPNWQRLAARSLHIILYVLLIVMPLSGWLMSTTAGHPINYFGLIQFTFPGVPENKVWAEIFETMHTWLAWVIIVLVSLHILAALKHHYVNKDNILKRMIPFIKK